MEKMYYKAPEFGELIGRSAKTVHRWIRAGVIRSDFILRPYPRAQPLIAAEALTYLVGINRPQKRVSFDKEIEKELQILRERLATPIRYEKAKRRKDA